MTWGFVFRLREYVRGSLWVVPLLGAIAGALLGIIVAEIDRMVGVPLYWQYSASTASALLATIAGAMVALVGFVVTVTVLVVQMATGTFSARYMRLWYRDWMLKATLALLAGTLTFSLSSLRRVEAGHVPDIGVTLAGLLVVLSLMMFLVFFDRFVHRLRPVAVAALVAKAGRQAFEEAAREAARPDAPDLVMEAYEPSGEPSHVVRSSHAGVIQAIYGAGLVRWARRHDCFLVLPHVVGDFVPTGAPLVEVHGGTRTGDFAARNLSGMIALGVERTIQQDPAFAVRIMVDIAEKALSPAVNDPTTAVQVLNHLGETLRIIGTADLMRAERKVEGMRSPVVMRARSWQEYLALGVTEIREYGEGSLQVMRRLRAVLEELQETVLPANQAAVKEEVRRLDATLSARWGDNIDFDSAGAADRQGIGGPGDVRRSAL